MTGQPLAVAIANTDDRVSTGSRGPTRTLLRFARARPLGAACSIVIICLCLLAVAAEVIAPYAPNKNQASARLIGPNSAHLLGTDNFGRDVLSRILVGSRTSVQVGLYSTVTAMLVALVLGVGGGYFRGPLDYAIGRVVEVAQAFPGLLLLITLVGVFGRSVLSISIILGLLTGIVSSRVVRGATLTIASQQFVEVARATGCSPLRIAIRHLIPNVFPAVIVLGSISVGSSIVAEASLSFLGYGIAPPTPSWGGMLSIDGRQFMVSAPWLFLAPTAALALTVFAVNMFGDALRDTLDPRLRGGR